MSGHGSRLHDAPDRLWRPGSNHVPQRGRGYGLRFEKFIRDYADEHHFNGSIRVEDDGKSLFHGSFGIADRAFHLPCSDDTKYKIASITKAFTAVLVLQLMDENKVDLDQPIGHYLSN